MHEVLGKNSNSSIKTTATDNVTIVTVITITHTRNFESNTLTD
jgi:hypothetical protein